MRKEPEVLTFYSDINIFELWRIAWGGKLTLIVGTLMAAVISVIYSLSIPNIYKSEILLAPSSSQSSSMSGLGSVAGLAGLAGISMNSGGVDDVALGLATLKSRAFITEFISKRDVLVPLLALDSWSVEGLEIDQGVYNSEKNEWVEEKPSMQVAYSAFIENLTVSKDPDSGLVTIGIISQSPELAQRWAALLVEDLNDSVREYKTKEAKDAIKFLEEEINSTSLVEMRSMFFGLVQQQIEIIMLANVRRDYLFKVVDPAVVPEVKTSPNRAMLCIVGTIIGGMISLVAVFARYFMSKREV